MTRSSCSDINTAAVAENETPILKNPVGFGNEVIAIALHKSLVRHFGITENTLFQQEIVESGIFLKIVPNTKTKDASF